MKEGARVAAACWLPAPSPGVACLILVAASLPLVFYGIGRYGIVGADEAFYQDIALSMLESGDWFRVQAGSRVHVYDTFSNAPLQYWVRGLIASLLGPTMLSARLMSAVSALLAVLATYAFTLHVAGRRAGFLAGVLLLTTFQFLYLHSARTGELEPLVCLLLVLQAHLFVRCIEEPRRSLLLHHVCLALLFLSKAPTIVIPLAAELVCFAVVPAARARFLDWLRLGLVMLPFAGAWHLYQAWVHWDSLAAVMVAVDHQASGSFVTGPQGGLTARLAYYGTRTLFGAFPFVLLYPIACATLALDAFSRPRRGGRTAVGLRVMLVFPLAVALFYLGISKVGPWYVVHAYPFLAALTGIWLARLHDRGAGIVGLGLLAVALAHFLLIAPEIAGYDPFARDAISIPMRTTWRELPGLSPAAAALVVSLVVAALLLALRRRVGADFAPRIAALVSVLFVGHALVRAVLPLAYVDHLSPVAALAADLAERRLAGQPIPLPIEIPRAHPWVVDYYFARDYEIAPAPGGNDPKNPSASRFVLVRERGRPEAGRR